jgi:hypothetical protein
VSNRFTAKNGFEVQGSTARVLDSVVFGSTVIFDTDAVAYIQAVEAVDGQQLELGVRLAIDTFVKGCKSDGIWDAIKASCIMAGARTLSGALVPLRGGAPTNFNFVSGDYDRKTGLVGDGSTKYLDSNRNNDADPRNSNHNAAFVSDTGGEQGALMGAGEGIVAGANFISKTPGSFVFSRNRSSSGTTSALTFATGLIGTSRSTSSEYAARGNGANQTIAVASNGVLSENVLIYRRAGSSSPLFFDARLSFYSIGESLNLAQLDARVSALMTALNTAIS